MLVFSNSAGVVAGHPAPAILPCGKRQATELESENDPAMVLGDEGPSYPKRGGFPRLRPRLLGPAAAMLCFPLMV
jgi:hypothetical protein